jgi:hypothetical protein
MKSDFNVLGEALDALDRLYDNDADVEETGAALERAGASLSERELGDQMIEVGKELVRISQLAHSDNEKRRLDGLIGQGEIRIKIAEAWSELCPPEWRRQP